MRSNRRTPIALAAVAAAVLLAAGCGDRGADGADTVDAMGSASGLPTLPPVAERFPEAFEPDGCPVGERPPCLSTAAETDAAAAQLNAGPEAARSLRGFSGAGWLPAPSRGEVTVLTETVTVRDSTTWAASGLVRNETDHGVSGIEVEARLLGTAGQLIGTARSTVALATVRSGEPAPFTLSAEVPAAEVAEVQWSTASHSSTDPDSRDLEVSVAWTRPYGGDPLDSFLYRDSGTARPYVLVGTTVNVGAPATGVAVTLAWLDAASGRVLHTETVQAVCITGDLPEGGSCDFVTVVADQGSALDGAMTTLWAETR